MHVHPQWFWLGFAFLNPFTIAGLVEFFLILAGRQTISERVGPAIQQAGRSDIALALLMLACIFLGVVLGWLAFHLSDPAQTR